MNSTNSIAVILVAVGIFFFFTKPMMAELSTTLDQKQEYQDKLEKVRTIGEIQKSLQNKLENISEAEKSKVDTLLPSSANITKFIADLDALANKNGISLENITYSDAVNNAGASVATGGGGEGFNRMGVNFSFKTDYKKLKTFISDLESSLRIIDIRSIDAGEGAKGVYNYNVSTEIYWLKN